MENFFLSKVDLAKKCGFPEKNSIFVREKGDHGIIYAYNNQVIKKDTRHEPIGEKNGCYRNAIRNETKLWVSLAQTPLTTHATLNNGLIRFLGWNLNDYDNPSLYFERYETNLENYLKTADKLSMRQIMLFLCCIAKAISTLHNTKICHLDVQPSNIMIKRVSHNEKIYAAFLGDLSAGIKRVASHRQLDVKIYSKLFLECCHEKYTENTRCEANKFDVFCFGNIMYNLFMHRETHEPGSIFSNDENRIDAFERCLRERGLSHGFIATLKSLLKSCWASAKKRPSAQEVFLNLIELIDDDLRIIFDYEVIIPTENKKDSTSEEIVPKTPSDVTCILL